jgi:hypothetical protein
LLLLM